MLIKKYDVEIAFLEGEPTKFLTLSTNKDSKKTAWVHIDLMQHRLMRREEERLMYKKIDEIICVSEQSRQKFRTLYSEYKTKCKANYNLIDKEQIVYLSSENPEFIFKKICIVAIGGRYR